MGFPLIRSAGFELVEILYVTPVTRVERDATDLLQ